MPIPLLLCILFDCFVPSVFMKSSFKSSVYGCYIGYLCYGCIQNAFRIPQPEFWFCLCPLPDLFGNLSLNFVKYISKSVSVGSLKIPGRTLTLFGHDFVSPINKFSSTSVYWSWLISLGAYSVKDVIVSTITVLSGLIGWLRKFMSVSIRGLLKSEPSEGRPL